MVVMSTPTGDICLLPALDTLFAEELLAAAAFMAELMFNAVARGFRAPLSNMKHVESGLATSCVVIVLSESYENVKKYK